MENLSVLLGKMCIVFKVAFCLILVFGTPLAAGINSIFFPNKNLKEREERIYREALQKRRKNILM